MALLGLGACGPSAGEPVEELHVRTCGGDGPARLIPDVVVVAVAQHGERLLAVGIASLDLAADDAFTVWAVGPCGEDPVILYEYERHGNVQIAGDLLLGCEDDGSVYRLDATGARPPVELLQGVSCRFEATPAGLLAHDPVHQAVRLHPAPHDDGVEVITIAEDVPDRSLRCDPDEPDCAVYQGRVPPYPFQVDGSSIFVIDAQARLSRIEPATQASVVVAENVADFVVLPGTERLLTEDVEIAQHGGQARGRIRLVDLTTGQSQPLHAMGLPLQIRWPIAVGLASETVDDLDFPRAFGAFDLRTGERLDMPRTSSLSVRNPPFVDEEHLVLTADGETADGNTYYRWSDHTSSWIEVASFATFSSAFQRNGRLEVMVHDLQDGDRELWLADFDGSGPALAASDVSGAWITRNDHVVWSDETSGESIDDQFGDLWVAELYDGRRFHMDDRAMLLVGPWGEPDLGGDVLYTVRDGERSGLWRSALR